MSVDRYNDELETGNLISLTNNDKTTVSFITY